MAAFIAKQMVGDKLNSVKGVIGKKDDDDDKKDVNEEGIDPELAEARREAEEKRKDKHRQMEKEREEMRQTIRDKYGLKKKEDRKQSEPECEGRLGRKKKSAADFASENDEDGDGSGGDSFLPSNLNDLQSKFGELPNKVMSSVGQAGEKCSVQ